MPTTDNTSPDFQLVLTPDKAALTDDGPTTLRLLVRVQAPDLPAGTVPRAPLHLALVLDRSGSMTGVPLAEAKRCARNMIDGLAAEDRAAIFAFDDTVIQYAPLTQAAGKIALAAALDGIESGGTTDLHGGWRAGAFELGEHDDGTDAVRRVILLSDGCANVGKTDPEEIALDCKHAAQRGISTSTYGLGEGFNEALMLAMAAAGHGNAYYGQTAADLAEPFAAEFALLASLCARGLVLKVKTPDGVSVKLRNAYDAVEGEPAAWKLPDLAFASEAWALLEFEIPAVATGETALATLPITVSVQAATRDSVPLFLIAGLPPLPVVDTAQRRALPADVLVTRRMLELAAGEMLQELRTAIAGDNWERARRLLDDAATRFHGHEWATAVLATMRRLVAGREKSRAMKEASFSSQSMHRRLASRDEAMYSEASERSIPTFLRRKPEQGKGQPEG